MRENRSNNELDSVVVTAKDVEPYLYVPEFTGSLLDWQFWQLSSATASTENHCYWAR